MVRIQKMHERLARMYQKEKKNAIAKCKKLHITYYEVGVNDAELYSMPDNYICIASMDEYAIGEIFLEGVIPGSLYISAHDYQIFII